MRNLSDKKREKILDAAYTSFLSRGVSQTSMPEIAKAAGVATGTLYLYFKDKNELVRGCALRFHNKHQDESAAIRGSRAPTLQKLERYVIGRYEAWEPLTHPRSASFVEAILLASKDSTTADTQLWFTTIEGLLTEAQEAQVYAIEDMKKDTLVFLTSIMGFFPLPGLIHPERPDVQQLKNHIAWFDSKWRKT